MPGDNGSGFYLVADALQIETGLRILAGGGRGPDGEGACIAQRSGNFIGYGLTQKIKAVVGTNVSKRKNGDGF
jgi:hypothetical protein